LMMAMAVGVSVRFGGGFQFSAIDRHPAAKLRGRSAVWAS
jgi:hypothetical protein